MHNSTAGSAALDVNSKPYDEDNESESDSHYITNGKELSSPAEFRDDELILATEELNDYTQMYGDEIASEADYEELRDDSDANELMQAAKELRHESNYSAGE